MIIRKVKVTEYEYQAPINYVAGATEPDIQFQLTDYEIPSGATGRVYVGRSDGTFEYTVATISGNNVTVAPTSSMFSVNGAGAIQVTLYVRNEVVKNFAVPVYVHSDLADDSAHEGTDVVGVFKAAEEEAMEDFSEDAEAEAARVIATIPADYTALTEEVDELNERIDDIEPGLSDDAKSALLSCFRHVSFLDNDADYYGALVSALYPNEYPKIIATYNPGSFVPTSGDPLSVLVPYLTVVYYETAESSGTTISPSNYTLSGSLSTAQSSITVQYLTCLTSFTVNVDVWDYVWNTTSGVLPTGMTADSYDFTTEAGILYVNTPQLNFNYFGDAEIEVEGKFAQSHWASHPQVCIVNEYPYNDNNHATLNAICGNRENYNIYIKGVLDGTTYGWLDTGLSQNQYHKLYIKAENGATVIRVDNNEWETAPFSDWVASTNFCTGIFSGGTNPAMFIKSIKFRRL